MSYLNTLLCSSVIVIAGFAAATQAVYADSHSSPSDSTTLPAFTLNSDEGKCSLSGNDSEDTKPLISLLLDAPCYWVTAQDNASGEPLSYSYPEKKADTVMLVAGGNLDWLDEKKTYHKLPLDTQCSQFLQGVIISDSEIYAIDTLMEAPHCQGLTVDEKVFQQAVESEVRYINTPPSLSSTESTTQETSNQKVVETASDVSETEPEEDDSLLDSIQKTIKKLFTKDE